MTARPPEDARWLTWSLRLAALAGFVVGLVFIYLLMFTLFGWWGVCLMGVAHVAIIAWFTWKIVRTETSYD